MSEIHIPELFAPAGGWRVRILDLSGGAEEGIVEDIAGFPTLMQANEFARRYVRDSIELCRKSGGDVISTWRMFGEDAHVIDAGEDTWRAEAELSTFADRPASASERNWRALDPRSDADGDDEEDEE
jgi:hypothetical protein